LRPAIVTRTTAPPTPVGESGVTRGAGARRAHAGEDEGGSGAAAREGGSGRAGAGDVGEIDGKTTGAELQAAPTRTSGRTDHRMDTASGAEREV
jgi:hypothetical protein